MARLSSRGYFSFLSFSFFLLFANSLICGLRLKRIRRYKGTRQWPAASVALFDDARTKMRLTCDQTCFPGTDTFEGSTSRIDRGLSPEEYSSVRTFPKSRPTIGQTESSFHPFGENPRTKNRQCRIHSLFDFRLTVVRDSYIRNEKSSTRATCPMGRKFCTCTVLAKVLFAFSRSPRDIDYLEP